MADAVNHQKIINDRLWALLLADPEWAAAFQANNRINLYADDIDAIKDSWNDSDFPECTIMVFGIDDSFYALERTYAMKPTATMSQIGSWVEDIQYTAQIVLIHDTLNAARAGQQEANTRRAIRKGGPMLAVVGAAVVALGFPIFPIANVSSRTQYVTSRVAERTNSGGTLRLATTIQVPIKPRLQGQTLV